MGKSKTKQINTSFKTRYSPNPLRVGTKVRALWKNENETVPNNNNWYQGTVTKIYRGHRCMKCIVHYFDQTEQIHELIVTKNRGLYGKTVVPDVVPSHVQLLANCSRDPQIPKLLLCVRHPKYDAECFYRAELLTIFINKPLEPLKVRCLDDGQELYVYRKDTRLLKK